MEPYTQGYNRERFEQTVDENFLCPICLNVLNEPLMCPRNGHCFCTPCITRYLQHSNNCPSCRDVVAIETLCLLPRLINNVLSNLRLHCDYFERGCLEFVKLGELKNHVANCGFSPILCSNEGCAQRVNKRDKIYHEMQECEFKKPVCHDCAVVKMEVGEATRKVQKKLFDIKEELGEFKDQMYTQAEQLRVIQQDVIQRIQNALTSMKYNATVQIPAQNSRQDIIIAGGDRKGGYRTTEVFKWSQMAWTNLEQLERAREGSAGVVFNGQVIVAGGGSPGFQSPVSDTMEAMNAGDVHQEWSEFPAKVPKCLKYFKSVVYDGGRLFVTGGWGTRGGIFSRHISEVSLLPPYGEKLLVEMPQPRIHHGIALMGNKVYIFGGGEAVGYSQASDSVLVYDVNTNECQYAAPLPHALTEMATATHGNSVYLVGGKNDENRVLNTVIKYNVVTGVCEVLPCEMKYSRAGSSAVITGNVLVVMGGYNVQRHVMSSVECLELGQNEWKEFPSMNACRRWACAVLKPS